MTDLLNRPQYTAPSVPPQFPPLPPNVTSHRDERDRRWPRRVAGGAALLALIAGGGVTGAVVAENYATDTPAAAATTTATSTIATSAGTGDAGLTTVAAKVSPSIVTVLIDGRNESAL